MAVGLGETFIFDAKVCVSSIVVCTCTSVPDRSRDEFEDTREDRESDAFYRNPKEIESSFTT